MQIAHHSSWIEEAYIFVEENSKIKTWQRKDTKKNSRDLQE